MCGMDQRVIDRVDRSGGDDACWPWMGHKNSGYGVLSIGNRERKAHRLVYEAAKGPIPDRMRVCHTCDNPPCCNPAHLFLGTRSDNAADMAAKGRAWSPLSDRNREATHCPQGHEYAPDNTYTSDGCRKCQTCGRARAALYREKNRDTINAQQTAQYRRKAEANGTYGKRDNHFKNREACSRGHPYTEENTLHYKGARYCRTCHRDRQRLRARRIRHARPQQHVA